MFGLLTRHPAAGNDDIRGSNRPINFSRSKRGGSGGLIATGNVVIQGHPDLHLASSAVNRFLKHWRLSGRREAFHGQIISYADDLVILSRGHAEDALTWTKAVMTKLGLTLNETKTSVKNARLESFDFLGIHARTPPLPQWGAVVSWRGSVEEKRAADQEEGQRTADAGQQGAWPERSTSTTEPPSARLVRLLQLWLAC